MSSGPPSSTPGEFDGVAEIEADVGKRCAVALVHRVERCAVPAPRRHSLTPWSCTTSPVRQHRLLPE